MKRLSRAHLESRFVVALKTLPKGTIASALNKRAVIESDDACKVIAQALVAQVDGERACVVMPDMIAHGPSPHLGRFGIDEPWPCELDWP